MTTIKMIDSFFMPTNDIVKPNDTFDLELVLEVTSAIIRTHEWNSSKKAKGFSVSVSKTVEYVKYFFNPTGSNKKFKRWVDSIRWNEEEDSKNAVLAMDWLAKNESSSDYIRNLKMILNNGEVPFRLFGYWTSLIPSWQQDVAKQQEVGKNENLNEYYGEKKEKVELRLTLVHKQHLESYYGVSTLHKFQDEQKRTFVWFATRDPDIAVGGQYRVKGTIKGYKEFNGVKQTMLTRCSIK